METPGVAIRSATGRWVVTVAVLGAALTFIDATVVAIALPSIVEDLGADVAAAVWVVTGYNLALAALVLTAGALGDRFGLRATYVVGVGGFTLASLVCGAAPSIGLLVAARVAQGVFAALLTPASLALVQESLRREDRARGVGTWSGLTGVAGAAGPVLGGLLVEHADWRWAFLVNLPLGVFVVWAVLRHLPASASERRTTGPVDWTGAALLTAALAVLTGVLVRGSTSLLDAALWVAAVVLAVVLVLHLRRAPDALVPGELWRDRAFRGVTVATFLFYGALALAFFMLPLVLQVGAGLTPLVAGSAQLPVTVLMLLFSGRVGALMGRTGAAPLMVTGALVAAAALAWLTGLGQDVSMVRDVLPPTTLLGVGLTLFVTPLTATALAAAPSDMVGLASGVNNAVARTGGLLTVALVPLVSGLAGDALSRPPAVVAAAGTVLAIGAALMVATALVVAATVPWRAGHPADDVPEPATERVPSAHCSPSCPPQLPADDVRR